MNTTVTLDKEGESGTLRPVRSASPLRKERGVWVFHGGRKISAAVTDKVLRNILAGRRNLAGC